MDLFDRVALNWQTLVNRGVLHEGHFLYQYIDNVLRYALYVDDPKTSRQAAWDKAIVLFCQSFLNMCGSRGVHFVRGPGFAADGILSFSFDDWNLPLPPIRTLQKLAPPWTTASGLQLHLIIFFLKLVAADGQAVPALYRSANFKLFAVNMLRDGTAIAPGCEPNQSTFTIDGASVRVDSLFIAQHPRPSPELLSSILYSEANVLILITACAQRFLPVGLEFGTKAGDKHSVFSRVTTFARQAQICLHCLETTVKAKELVIPDDVLDDCKCNSSCQGVLCSDLILRHVCGFLCRLRTGKSCVRFLCWASNQALVSIAAALLDLHQGQTRMRAPDSHWMGF